MTSKEQYSKICLEKKGVPVFMQPWWLDAVCPHWDAAIARNGDEVAGIWAYPVENKMGVSMVRTPMLTPYLGPHIFFPADLKESRADSYEHDTVSDLLKQLPDAKVWHLALAPGMKQAGLFKKHKLHAEVQQTFLLDLAEEETALFANIKETARRNIRQAEKEYAISNDPALTDKLFAYQEHTLTQKGRALPYTAADLHRIMKACTAHNASALWVAGEPGNPEAIVWQVWDDQRSYYLAGGQNPAANGYKAMTLLLWHAIREARRRGNSVFDFEGSMDEGVERFFRNFGGRRELYMVLQKNESLLWKIKKGVMG